MSATPRPWTDHYDGPPTVMGDGHVVACSFEPDDVRLIVRAVNGFDALKDALRGLLASYDANENIIVKCVDDLDLYAAADAARAALKDAEK